MRLINIPLCELIEEEIAASRGDSSVDTKGIMGELFKALSCLFDPVLMEPMSPRFDYSLGNLCNADQKMNLCRPCSE